MKRKMKRVISYIMVVTLLMAFFPPLLYAANSDSQVEYAGGTVYYNAAGQQVNAAALGENNSVVSLSKTVKGTDTTNEFIIDLKVETSIDISQVQVSADAAVVLVLDVSGSMAGQKIADMKAAANNFLSSFSQATAGTSRYVSLVTYDTNAKTVHGWTDVTVPTNLSSLQSTVSNLAAGSSTNIHGGLILARDLLNSPTLPQDITNLSTVLFTDGLANVSNSGDPKTSASQVAAEIKNPSGINAKLYTIAFGNDADEAWLAGSIATNSTYAYKASNAQDLNSVFASISQSIERWAQAWVVTDPMGANIEFLQTIPQNDISSGLLNFSNGTLQWNLKDGNPVAINGNVNTYTYSYRIGLDITASNFDFDAIYDTNKPTILNYVMVTNGVPGTTVLEGNFLIPKVKAKEIKEPEEPKDPKEPKKHNKKPQVGKWVKNPDVIIVPLVPKSGY